MSVRAVWRVVRNVNASAKVGSIAATRSICASVKPFGASVVHDEIIPSMSRCASVRTRAREDRDLVGGAPRRELVDDWKLAQHERIAHAPAQEFGAVVDHPEEGTARPILVRGRVALARERLLDSARVRAQRSPRLS